MVVVLPTPVDPTSAIRPPSASRSWRLTGMQCAIMPSNCCHTLCGSSLCCPRCDITVSHTSVPSPISVIRFSSTVRTGCFWLNRSHCNTDSWLSIKSRRFCSSILTSSMTGFTGVFPVADGAGLLATGFLTTGFLATGFLTTAFLTTGFFDTGSFALVGTVLSGLLIDLAISVQADASRDRAAVLGLMFTTGFLAGSPATGPSMGSLRPSANIDPTQASLATSVLAADAVSVCGACRDAGLIVAILAIATSS